MEKKQNVVKVILLWCLLGVIPIFPLFFDTTLQDNFSKCRCTAPQQNVGLTTVLKNQIFRRSGCGGSLQLPSWFQPVCSWCPGPSWHTGLLFTIGQVWMTKKLKGMNLIISWNIVINTFWPWKVCGWNLFFHRLLRKVTLKIVVITAFFVICVAPFAVSFLVASVSEQRKKMSKVYFRTQALALLNSALQPVLVCCLSRPVRTEVARLACAWRSWALLLKHVTWAP